MKTDHHVQLLAKLEHLESKGIPDFCKEWKEQWRGIAVAAQSILEFFFPVGAKVIGILITIADSSCKTK